jgi:hypothetical protein
VGISKVGLVAAPAFVVIVIFFHTAVEAAQTLIISVYLICIRMMLLRVLVVTVLMVICMPNPSTSITGETIDP